MQPLTESELEQLTVGVPQLSLATTNAFTLSHVGSVAGLQPKLLPVGQVVMVGFVVSLTGIVSVSPPQQVSPGQAPLLLQAVSIIVTFPPQPAVTVKLIELVPRPPVIVPPVTVQL